uniref:Uncharacterized protein n=1 Tax=Anguilla anguilla TaxID=7936 RepID=A0A0E9RUN7_ANGAN
MTSLCVLTVFCMQCLRCMKST